jgi:hypothetical protein
VRGRRGALLRFTLLVDIWLLGGKKADRFVPRGCLPTDFTTIMTTVAYFRAGWLFWLEVWRWAGKGVIDLVQSGGQGRKIVAAAVDVFAIQYLAHGFAPTRQPTLV